MAQVNFGTGAGGAITVAETSTESSPSASVDFKNDRALAVDVAFSPNNPFTTSGSFSVPAGQTVNKTVRNAPVNQYNPYGVSEGSLKDGQPRIVVIGGSRPHDKDIVPVTIDAETGGLDVTFTATVVRPKWQVCFAANVSVRLEFGADSPFEQSTLTIAALEPQTWEIRNQAAPGVYPYTVRDLNGDPLTPPENGPCVIVLGSKDEAPS